MDLIANKLNVRTHTGREGLPFGEKQSPVRIRISTRQKLVLPEALRFTRRLSP